MNKTTILIAIMALFMSVAVLADVDVHGTVKQADGFTDAGAGIEVTVSCDHESTITSLQDTTDVNSEYLVSFLTSECDVGDSVTASVPGDELTHTVEQKNLTLEDLYVLNIELQVPEFSTIAAGVAFAGAGIGYLFMRRRR